ncbi:unnamed protein product [Orchesella dallaii]|uniref:Uncharacterized protein n=1 Tax=Orchesella dallaii TaxID=48710 RepID=A0ABP1S4A5_9HEXA
MKRKVSNFQLWKPKLKSISGMIWPNLFCPYPTTSIRMHNLQRSGTKTFCMLNLLEKHFNFSVPQPKGIKWKHYKLSAQDVKPDLFSIGILSYKYLSKLNFSYLNYKPKDATFLPNVLDPLDKLEFAVVLSEQLLPNFAALFVPLDETTWIMLAVSVVIISALLFKHAKSISTSFLWVWALLTDQDPVININSRVRMLSLSIVMSILFYESFEIRNWYAVGIYSIVTFKPLPKLPVSFEDSYLQQSIPILSLERGFDYGRRGNTCPNLLKCARSFCPKYYRCVCDEKLTDTYKYRRQIVNKVTIGHVLRFINNEESEKAKDNASVQIVNHLPDTFMLVNVPEYLDLLRILIETFSQRKIFRSKDFHFVDRFSKEVQSKTWIISAGPLSKHFAEVMRAVVESGIYDLWDQTVVRVRRGIRVRKFFEDLKYVVRNSQEGQDFNPNSWFNSVVFGNGKAPSWTSSAVMYSISLKDLRSFWLLTGGLGCLSLLAFLLEFVVKISAAKIFKE